MARKGSTWVTNLGVVGLQFRWKKQGRDMLRRACPLSVTMEREPDNPKDPNAIKVILNSDRKLATLRGRQLGYLRKEAAEILAPRLDAGTVEVVYGVCHSIDEDGQEGDCEWRLRDVKSAQPSGKRKR